MIPSDKPHLVVAANSHPGEARVNNEDRYSVTAYTFEESTTPALLAIVADGIGGHRAGEIASEMTVDTITEALTATDGSEPLAQLQSAVVDASRLVSQAAEADTDRQGMGSTVAVAWIIGSRLYTSTVGDSRIYLLRQGKLRQISVDHTWVQEAIEYNIITPEQARDHPQAHVLRRHIGGSQIVEPDMRLQLKDDESASRSEANQGLQIKPGEQILLCSDGLTDLVDDVEIQQALKKMPPDQTVSSLTDLARKRGGHDNITIVVLLLPKTVKQKTESQRPTRTPVTVIGIVGLVGLIAVILAATWWFGLWPWSSPTPSSALATSSVIPPANEATLEVTSLSPTTPIPENIQPFITTPTPISTPMRTSTPYPLPTVVSSASPDS